MCILYAAPCSKNCSYKIFLKVVWYTTLELLHMIYTAFPTLSQVEFPDNRRDNSYRSDMNVRSIYTDSAFI